METDGYIDVLNEGIFVARDAATEWLPDHFAFCEGVLNFSSKAISLPAGRDRVIRDEIFARRRQEVTEKSFGLAKILVEKTRVSKRTDRDFAGLLLAYIYKKADSASRTRILTYMDDYSVPLFRSDGRVTLGNLQHDGSPIYIQYNKGRWVTDLAIVDGKQIYHKEDDFVELQAAILAQENQRVITTARYDSGDEKLSVEADLVKGYFKANGTSYVDLTLTNVIEGKQRSRPVPNAVRQEVGPQTKFVEVPGLPNKRVWKVGSEMWINLSHPLMRRAYDALQGGTDPTTLRLAAILFRVLSYQLDDTVAELVTWMGT